jgi:thioesterase domain-containing protein
MDITEIQSLISQKIPLAEFLGIQIEAVEPGHARLRLPFSLRSQNHLEIVYAGAIFSLAEIAGGIAMISVFDTSKYTILIERLSIEFVRPSRRDLWCDLTLPQDLVAQVKAQVAEEGKAKITLPVKVVDERQRVIARVEGAYYLRRARTSN